MISQEGQPLTDDVDKAILLKEENLPADSPRLVYGHGKGDPEFLCNRSE